MAGYTNHLKNLLLDSILRGYQYSHTTPASYYVALYVGDPDAAGVEVSGGDYARVAVSRTSGAWNGTHGTTTGPSSGTTGRCSNAVLITSPAPTGNWGTITHFALFDASTAGNKVGSGALDAPITVNSGDPAPEFAPGALKIDFT